MTINCLNILKKPEGWWFDPTQGRMVNDYCCFNSISSPHDSFNQLKRPMKSAHSRYGFFNWCSSSVRSYCSRFRCNLYRFPSGVYGILLHPAQVISHFPKTTVIDVWLQKKSLRGYSTFFNNHSHHWFPPFCWLPPDTALRISSHCHNLDFIFTSNMNAWLFQKTKLCFFDSLSKNTLSCFHPVSNWGPSAC